VLTSQVEHALGIRVKRQQGIGKLVKIYIEIGKNIATVNLVTLAIALSTLVVCIFFDRVVSPKLKEKCRFPIPTQLAMIIIFTTLSKFMGFRENYDVRTIDAIGKIPVGIPEPVVPTLELIPQVFMDSIAPAVVAFAIGLGLGKMFGQKHGYEVQSNQELLAQGAANLFGSFFNCIPMAGSLSRSVVQEASGCRTMLTGLISALLLLSVMLYLGPLFQPLPVCVLAAIIISSLFGIIKKLQEVGHYWNISISEGIIWIATFLATVFLDVDFGLIVGVLVTLLFTVIKAATPTVTVLERGTDGVWLDKKIFRTEGGTKVIQLFGPVHFLVQDSIRTTLQEEFKFFDENGLTPTHLISTDLVLDVSGVTYLDQQGIQLISWTEKHLAARSINLGVVATSQQLSLLNLDCEIFPTYTDALLILNNNTALHQNREMV